MEKNYDGIGNEITKLAQIAEIIENSFFQSNKVNLDIHLDPTKFQELLKYLNYDTDDNKCIISIGEATFTFWKK